MKASWPRRTLDRAFLVSSGFAALTALCVLVVLGTEILRRAWPVLEPSFLLRESAEAGASGGVFYQLLGTALLMLTALVLCLPLAVGLALTRSVYASGRWRRRLSVLLLAANGVPSVLFGIAGFLVFSRYLGWGKSWLAGGGVLALMMLPTAAVALSERIEALPSRQLEAAAGLGLSRSQIVRAVILPQCRGGLVSGLLLGLARAAGETAPILFCAAVFSGATLPHAVAESPVVALPYHIFTLAQDSFGPGTEARLWAAAAVLLGLTLSLSLAALPFRLAHARSLRHG